MSLLVVCCCLFVAVSAEGQDDPTPVHVLSPAANNARYAIVQSTVVVRDTFRLDRYTGRIHRIVKEEDGTLVWEEMVVHERPKLQTASTPRFQLFLSGTSVRHTYLLDTSTGDTWQVMIVENETSKSPSNASQDESDKVTEWFPVSVFNLKK